MKLIIVESPAKAKTLHGYLGSDYKILASYGHIRDLPSKDGSVDPTDHFNMKWETSDRSKKILSEIQAAAKKASALYLATDPDREGEAISWHIYEILKEKKCLPLETKRIVFHEVTKSALLEALAHPRDINPDLVEAYLARRALDYLVGFTLSPILWRKLPGSRSAGRVQSVALRLITEREAQIEAFTPQEYWSIDACMKPSSGRSINSRLVLLHGKKLEKFSLPTEKTAHEARSLILSYTDYAISSVKKKEVQRHPTAPFTTSTLQQEAARKLGFSASRTMRVAQSLYEGINCGGETVGLITYMRTDSVTLSKSAVTSMRDHITSHYGDSYVSLSPRVYKTKSRNAQEAHEGIRPTLFDKAPSTIQRFLTPDEAKLYGLIWKRTLASQMASARYNQVSVDILNADQTIGFRTTGSTLIFDGFLKVYEEGSDPEDKSQNQLVENATDKILPPLTEGEPIAITEVNTDQHFTEPPPRFTEASLVKRLEELGIGRPSTYASIIQVLQQRNYVRLTNKQFIPEERGIIVTTFLENFFDQFVAYSFTAGLEDKLDLVSEGNLKWKDLLEGFWIPLKENAEQTKTLRISEVIDLLQEKLQTHLFGKDDEGNPSRHCTQCADGKLSLKLGKFGAFIGCSNYPTCRYTCPIGDSLDATPSLEDGSGLYPKVLGTHPESGMEISLRKGPYGPYVQLESAQAKEKPKRMALPRGMTLEAITLSTALDLLSLPKELGLHPDTKDPISVGIGRFGPYIKHQSRYVSIKGDHEVTTISLLDAIDILTKTPIKHKKESPSTIDDKLLSKKSASREKKSVDVKKKKTSDKKSSSKKTSSQQVNEKSKKPALQKKKKGSTSS